MNETSHLQPDGTTFPPVTPDPPAPPGYTPPPEIDFALDSEAEPTQERSASSDAPSSHVPD